MSFCPLHLYNADLFCALGKLQVVTVPFLMSLANTIPNSFISGLLAPVMFLEWLPQNKYYCSWTCEVLCIKMKAKKLHPCVGLFNGSLNPIYRKKLVFSSHLTWWERWGLSIPSKYITASSEGLCYESGYDLLQPTLFSAVSLFPSAFIMRPSLPPAPDHALCSVPPLMQYEGQTIHSPCQFSI